MNKDYLDITGLTDILQKLKAKLASLVHTHTKEDITDYIVDTELSSTSTNPVENKTIKAEFDLVDDKIRTDIDSLRNELKTYVDEISPEIDVNHDHDDKYYTEEEIDAKLDEAKQYADNIKNDLLNGAGEAYDTLKELGELIDENVDAIEALESVATNKANKDHNHDEVYEKKEDAELKYDELKVKDWNQNDETASDYIKNRTHYETTSLQSSITWDGNLDVYENKDCEGIYFVKVSDTIPSDEELQGKTITVMYEGNEITCDVSSEWDNLVSLGNVNDDYVTLGNVLTSEYGYTYVRPFVFVVKTMEGAEYHGVSRLGTGIYFAKTYEDPVYYTTSFDLPVIKSTIYKLDEKFIPNTIARTSYVDEAIASIPTPDVSWEINEHNTSDTAHEDIRKLIDELPDPIEIDNTLKVEGAAADAKVVGDELSSCRVDITRIKEEALTIQNMPYSISDLNSESVNPYQWHTPIVYGNGKYVAVGETHFTTSVDGINWETPKLHSHDGEYVKGAYGNGKFVFVSNNNKYGYPITIYTEDCVTWDYIALPTEQPIPVIDIIFKNGMFVKLYSRIGEGLSPVSYSTDGINWNFSNPYTCSEYEYQSYDTNKIIYKDDKFIIPIFNNFYSVDESRLETEGIVVLKYLILYSTDCISWSEYITQIPVNVELFEPGVASSVMIDFVCTDEKCIAISERRTFYTSTNGLDWTISENLLPLANYRGNEIPAPWSSIVYNSNKNLFVLLGEVFFAYSNDGETWYVSDENSDGISNYKYIVSGEDKFIAQSLDNLIAFSNDGNDWNFAVPSVTNFNGINKTDSLKEALDLTEVVYMDKEDNEDIPDESAPVIDVVDPMTATTTGQAADAYKTKELIDSLMTRITQLETIVSNMPSFVNVQTESEAKADTTSNTYYFVPEE